MTKIFPFFTAVLPAEFSLYEREVSINHVLSFAIAKAYGGIFHAQVRAMIFAL